MRRSSHHASCQIGDRREKANRPMMRMCFSAMMVFGVAIASADDPPQPKISKAGADFFESKIRPLLVDHCYECHSKAGESEGELQLDSAAAFARGGIRGRLVNVKAPDKSLLMRAVHYRESDLQMPPDGKLSDQQIRDLRQWIEMGVPDPRRQSETAASHESDSDGETLPTERDPQSHWAYRSPQLVSGPLIDDSDSRDLIDAVARQAAWEKGLAIQAVASKEVLIRRLYFDLTGLPPDHAAVQKYLQSTRPDAYRRLVDSLLATPAFAERFARHWMDVSRYADTVGYALAGRPRRFEESERFRDWAIRAFASDMPYDEMLRHQLAGDRTDPENKAGNLDAMGFLTLGRRFLNPLDTIDDRVDVISRGLLGMTVTCARCHDHKFDPIPSADYYSLAGIIFSSDEPKEGASPLMMVDKPNPVDSPILIRGQLGNRGPIAPRQFLTALRKPGEPRFNDGSGRWELVQRIVAKDNPLTARVMVNRIWAQLIGKPLVDSPSDFGFRTAPPAIPEVLDDLAADFATHWSVKKTVRRIVMTRIYRQSAAIESNALSLDPDNRYLARANRRRRDFESLRDSMLSVSGTLDRQLGGAPVEITLDTPNPRRTVYALIDRQNLPALFRTFDFANPDAHSPGRYFTTVPQQSLFLLNNRQMHASATATANRIRQATPASDARALATNAFRIILGREPVDSELRDASEFLMLESMAPEKVIDSRGLWTYGTGKLSEDGNSVSGFEPLPFFRQGRWQSDEEFPSKSSLGYAYLGKDSGHTANDLKTVVVRRFTAPFDGRVSLRGTMEHRQKEGDGIDASVWIAGKRVFRANPSGSNRPYGPLSGKLRQGDTVDLVAAPGGSSSHDTFYWHAVVKLVSSDGRVAQADSKKHFSGPFDDGSLRPLDRLAQLAQALMMSNEFAFID